MSRPWEKTILEISYTQEKLLPCFCYTEIFFLVMLGLFRFLCSRPVCIPLTSPVRQKLTATINLGTQLFNPFRFSTVLSTISNELVSTSSGESEDISDQFSKYMQSAIACFKEKSNLALIGFDQTVVVLRLLAENLSDLPLSTEVYNVIAGSLIESLSSATDTEFTDCLVAMNREGLTHLIDDHEPAIKERSDKIKSAKCRIRLVESHVVSEEESEEFLRPVAQSNVKKLAQLSETELAILLSVFPESENLVDVFEMKLLGDKKSPNEIVEIIRNVRALESANLARTLFTSFFGDNEVELLSIENQIDAAWIGCEKHIRGVVNNLVWRLGRDPGFLTSIDTEHVVKLIEICCGIDARQSTILLRGAAKATIRNPNHRDMVGLFRAMSLLPGNPWIEHSEVGESILRTFIHFSPAGSTSEKSVCELWTSFVDSVRVTDWSIVKSIARKLTRSDEVYEKLRSIVECSEQESRLGNIVVARVLSLSTLSDGAYDTALSSLEESGTLPLNLKLSSLKPIQIIDLLQRLKSIENPQRPLHSVELLAEAAVSTNIAPTITEKMEMLRLLSSEHKYPATSLITCLADEISALSVSQFLDFVHLCANVRCAFPSARVVEYIGLIDLRQIDPTRVVDLVEDLSSLGMLRTEGLASRLVTSFTSNSQYNALDQKQCAKLSARLLSSLCLSLVIPSEKHLTALCQNIKGHEIDDFDMQVISEFATVVDEDKLRELVQGWSCNIFPSDQQSHVLPEETMNHPCEELTQLKKFKLFTQKRTHSNLVSWISHM